MAPGKLYKIEVGPTLATIVLCLAKDTDNWAPSFYGKQKLSGIEHLLMSGSIKWLSDHYQATR